MASLRVLLATVVSIVVVVLLWLWKSVQVPRKHPAYEARWKALPEHVRTPAQLLGKTTLGCEGTHSVFPQCNFACKPCYHGEDANKVGIDAEHAHSSIEEQMQYMEEKRGRGVHAQLIGGEVTLLGAQAHAEALVIMSKAGRLPMSMTHGDFDIEYLRQLCISGHFSSLSFAAHFDSFMFGRKGIKRCDNEAQLNPFRNAFVQMFETVKQEGLLKSYFLAHNMTITPNNYLELAAVLHENRHAGWRLFSLQPAAFVGDEKRWTQDFRAISDDEIWRELEKGMNCEMPYRMLQMGDERCNRTVWGVWIGDLYFPFLVPGEERYRDAYIQYMGSFQFGQDSIVELLRVIIAHPNLILIILGWIFIFWNRVGFWNLISNIKNAHSCTYVMHSFMDASVTQRAWELMQKNGETRDEEVKAAMERLQACSYSFGHPESDRMIPGCVQHGVLDPQINAQLKKTLPLTKRDLEW